MSTHTHSLKVGLAIPLAACVLMLALYFRDWSKEALYIGL